MKYIFLKSVVKQWLIGLALIAQLVMTHAFASESQKFINYFSNSERGDIRSIVEDMYWSGITDARLYNMIEKEVKASYQDDSKAAQEINSWLVKALAISGNKKYLATLQDIETNANSKKLRKHTTNAIEMLNEYSVWVPIMNKGVSDLSESKRDRKRVQNMLESNNSEMIRIGAKRVYHDYTSDAALLASVEKSLLLNHSKSDDSVHVDAMAWLIKALAESLNNKYKSSLEKVAAETTNKKIRKYAEKYANYL
ncbi:MAG: hypothetical protein OEZ23_01655 [Gammaproteobacteria bacterium]|nr:hypothetical protein [Gammaproteobacteria bacterium]